MNPATHLHRVWSDLLALKDKHLSTGTMQHLGRERGIFVSGHDSLDRPIISFSAMGFRAPPSMGDFALRADGSFHVNWYDNDLKHVCGNTFLGWTYVARERVLFFNDQRPRMPWYPGFATLDPQDHDKPKAYFRWRAFDGYVNRIRRQEVRFHLAPDGETWRIAIHPESDHYAWACRTLDAEYDRAARRYLRAERRTSPRPRSEQIDYSNQIQAISMLLEPYEPAKRTMRPKTRPKEEHHGQERDHLDTRS